VPTASSKIAQRIISPRGLKLNNIMKYQITITKTSEVDEHMALCYMKMGINKPYKEPTRVFYADNITPDQAIELLQHLYDLTNGKS
jgi:hypothetical protein